MVILLFVLISLIVATKEKFTTNYRQVYASWYNCDNSCSCDYYYVVGYDQTTRSNQDIPPAYYFYYNHGKYDSCSFIYSSEYYSTSNPNVGVTIRQNGNSASLINNFIDSSNNQISLNLDFSTQNTNDASSCNCREIYTSGADFYNIKTNSKSSYANVTGTIIINSNTLTLPNDAYGYIYDYGIKTIIYQKK
jgi:hypothetical protein